MSNETTENRGDWQDVRLAVVMNGGVSLAIWIGGVTQELSRLVQASRGVHDPHGLYGELLTGLRATARIDVISGTSAGGVNGGFLALGLVHNCDLTPLGELWAEKGDFAALLRDPMAADPPSLLRGDDYFLTVARTAYAQVLNTPLPVRAEPEAESVELFITTTLLEGKVSTFTDDQGTVIRERDFGATFRFANRGLTGCGDLANRDRIADELAIASRATASFPGAFEPHWLSVGADCDQSGDQTERWNSSAGPASFNRSQYVVDGGVLQNKPIRPALDAVYRQPADRQVRRVLAYVVPDPGAAGESRGARSTSGETSEPTSDQTSKSTVDRAPDQAPAGGPPTAAEVLLAVNTRLKGADSVARELDEIRRRNRDSVTRRAARARLADALAAGSGALVSSLWPGYLSERRANAGRVIAGFVSDRSGGQALPWSQAELAAAVRDLPDLPFVPCAPTFEQAAGLPAADWSWGLTAVQRLGATCVDVFRRALWLAPLAESEVRDRLIADRARLHEQLATTRELHAQVDRFWRNLPLPPPPAPGSPINRSATLSQALAESLKPPAPGISATGSAVWDKAARYREALALAELLRSAAPQLRQVAAGSTSPLDPEGAEHHGLSAILTHLLGPDRAPRDRDGVLRALLELDVVQTSISGASDEPEQTVELVQVSAHANASVGPPVEQKLTGVQLHHFGAFYRKSWRVNDWMWGRLDAATRLTETLLVPERLQQLGQTSAEALALIQTLATTADRAEDRAYLLAQFDQVRCARELQAALEPADPRAALPPMLPGCAAQLARARHLSILREELPRLAMAIRTDADQTSALSARNQAWLVRYQDARASGIINAADAFALLRANDIGSQRIEDDLGSDGLTELTASAAAVVAGALARTNRFRPVRLGLSALRGYALLLWAMVLLTRNRGRIGVAVVQAAVISGAALLALSLLVPGIPAAVSLLGVSVIMTTITLGCLRSLSLPPATAGPGALEAAELARHRRRAVRRIGLRMAVPSVLLLGVVIALAVKWGQLQVQTETVTKAAVTLAVVLVGTWLGRVSVTPRRSGVPDVRTVDDAVAAPDFLAPAQIRVPPLPTRGTAQKPRSPIGMIPRQRSRPTSGPPMSKPSRSASKKSLE